MTQGEDLGEQDYGVANVDPTKIPPRTLGERLRLAIRWSLSRRDAEADPHTGFARRFVRELDYVGLKLVWKDGAELTEAQLADKVGCSDEDGR